MASYQVTSPENWDYMNIRPHPALERGSIAKIHITPLVESWIKTNASDWNFYIEEAKLILFKLIKQQSLISFWETILKQNYTKAVYIHPFQAEKPFIGDIDNLRNYFYSFCKCEGYDNVPYFHCINIKELNIKKEIKALNNNNNIHEWEDLLEKVRFCKIATISRMLVERREKMDKVLRIILC